MFHWMSAVESCGIGVGLALERGYVLCMRQSWKDGTN